MGKGAANILAVHALVEGYRGRKPGYEGVCGFAEAAAPGSVGVLYGAHVVVSTYLHCDWLNVGAIIAGGLLTGRMDLAIDNRVNAVKTRPQDDADYLFPNLCKGEGLFGVVITAELLSILIVVVEVGINRFDWLLLGTTSLMALWVTLLSAAGLCLTRNLLAQYSHTWTAVFSYGLILLVTALVSLAGQGLMSFLNPDTNRFSIDVWRLLNHVIIAAIPAGILLRHLYLQQMLRVQQRAELESRIQALQSRIRPHFLFNSMN